MSTAILKGDFSALAENYAKYRPDYARPVLSALIGLINKPAQQMCFADVGAGTGIWTRMLASIPYTSVIAVEPNDAMCCQGIASSRSLSNISWVKGSAEKTHLESNSLDLLTMASSFHWSDFETTMSEFQRVLKPGGWFAALWNPRHIENNPLLLQIEAHISKLAPKISRVSSGKSEFVETLSHRFNSLPAFNNLTYLESMHDISYTKAEYIGVWLSVNDIRHQMGEEKFTAFIDFLNNQLADGKIIRCAYLTRMWAMQKK